MSEPTIKAPFLETKKTFKTHDPNNLRDELDKNHTEIAFAVNSRTIGIFDNFQVVSGNQYFSTTGNLEASSTPKRRQAYRKAFQFQGSPTVIPHGLSFVEYYTMIYGTALTASGEHIPLPYTDPLTNADIAITIDSTNINIGYDSQSFTLLSGVIVLEYVLSNQ